MTNVQGLAVRIVTCKRDTRRKRQTKSTGKDEFVTAAPIAAARLNVAPPRDGIDIYPWPKPSKPLFNDGKQSRADILLPVWGVGIGFGSETAGWSLGWVSAVDSNGEQYGLRTRIAATVDALLCARMKY